MKKQGKMLCVVGAVVALAGGVLGWAQAAPVVTGDARVDRLLNLLTLEEKLVLIHGTQEDPAVYQGQAGYLGGVKRLGIPGLRFADGQTGFSYCLKSFSSPPAVPLRAAAVPPSAHREGVQFPVRALAAFDRVHLAAGEAKVVTLHVAERQLQYWSTKDQKWEMAAGKRTVSVGGSSRNLEAKQEIN